MNKAEKEAHIKELRNFEVSAIRTIQQDKRLSAEQKVRKIATIQAWYKHQRDGVK